MDNIPRDPSLDSTLALLRDPYGFISKRCQRYQSDVFQARLLLQPTLFMSGPEAAALFYDEKHFTRIGAAPRLLLKTLFGQGGVQGLDGEAHRHRKQMFMSLMTPERIAQLGEISAAWWEHYIEKWSRKAQVVLYDELSELLTQAVCTWAGVPLEESKGSRRASEDLKSLFDQGHLGRGHIGSRMARWRAEQWIASLIEAIRNGRFVPPEESAAYVVAQHRDLNGNLLGRHTAAVELINVLRPTVAVSVYITFIALALHHYPVCQQRLKSGEEGYIDLFVQEVRRFYPFFPAVMARVRHNFEWRGYAFPQGYRVLLDLYGTNHDARTWEQPEAFRPERFREWNGSPFNFIPQGGGDHFLNHRCPGEWIALELMKVAVDSLVNHMKYGVEEQDLRIDYSRLPALPRSRFIITHVREAP